MQFFLFSKANRIAFFSSGIEPGFTSNAVRLFTNISLSPPTLDAITAENKGLQ